MIPDYLIYDELKQRQRDDDWKPERLELPLYIPHNLEDEPEKDDDGSEISRGVVIIDMNAGEDF